MFERFTDRARQAVVLAQEEARLLQHNYIGTEHVLLGLIHVGDSIAAQALSRFGLTLDAARLEVRERVDAGQQESPSGHIPFTPRSKKILEYSLREALSLGYNYIGTEHILLGLIRVTDGFGAQVVAAHAPGNDLNAVRAAVIDLLPAVGSGPATPSERTAKNMTPAAEAALDAATHLAGEAPLGSHHLLLGALADPDSVVSRSLASLDLDVDELRTKLQSADVTGSTDESPEEAGRRHLQIRVTDDRLSIETAELTLVDLARAALDALGDDARSSGELPTDLPVTASLGTVWRSLRDSLDDIRRRAAEPTDAPADEPGSAA
jgi:ATP-dependent Clp protease ATP-binding subunit ClpA